MSSLRRSRPVESMVRGSEAPSATWQDGALDPVGAPSRLSRHVGLRLHYLRAADLSEGSGRGRRKRAETPLPVMAVRDQSA